MSGLAWEQVRENEAGDFCAMTTAGISSVRDAVSKFLKTWMVPIFASVIRYLMKMCQTEVARSQEK